MINRTDIETPLKLPRKLPKTPKMPKTSAASLKMECSVCDEEFTSSRTITCPKCDNVTCKACMKQFIETNGTDACCLNEGCDTTWTRRFLTENFGTSYVNGKYKKMIDLNRVDRVVATNARFMEDAKRYKTLKQLEAKKQEADSKTKLLQTEMWKLSHNYQRLKDALSRDAPVERVDELNAAREKYLKVRDVKWRADDAHIKYRDRYLVAKREFDQGKSTSSGDGEKVIYQKPCPKPECKGFLSQKGICGMCKIHVCSKCNVPKGITEEEIVAHECKKEDIESVEAIRKETKPCPRCGTRIHKLSGCDQMWCPYCQDKYGEGTTFSWRTGKIERGRIHNPHYIDYMRNRKANLREVGDVHCGGLPQTWQFDHKLQSPEYGGRYIGDVPLKTRTRVMNILRRLSEINQYVVNPLREKLRQQNIHRMAQIKHIVGEINDKKFRLAISRTEKKVEKDQEILDIFEVVVAVLTEKINQVYNDPSDLNIILFLSFVEKFVEEENLCLANISYLYKQNVNIVKVDSATYYRASEMKLWVTTKKALEKYRRGESWAHLRS